MKKSLLPKRFGVWPWLFYIVVLPELEKAWYFADLLTFIVTFRPTSSNHPKILKLDYWKGSAQKTSYLRKEFWGGGAFTKLVNNFKESNKKSIIVWGNKKLLRELETFRDRQKLQIKMFRT
jgi:hypothetical protein